MNRGELTGVYSYRDRRGLEADVVVDQGDAVAIVEVKAGQTVTAEMFRALEQVDDGLSGTKRRQRVLVYGGDAAQTRQVARVIPWNEVDQYNW
jgi:Holliday junction resolvase-like predicted endonuclease